MSFQPSNGPAARSHALAKITRSTKHLGIGIPVNDFQHSWVDVNAPVNAVKANRCIDQFFIAAIVKGGCGSGLNEVDSCALALLRVASALSARAFATHRLLLLFLIWIHWIQPLVLMTRKD